MIDLRGSWETRTKKDLDIHRNAQRKANKWNKNDKSTKKQIQRESIKKREKLYRKEIGIKASRRSLAEASGEIRVSGYRPTPNCDETTTRLWSSRRRG